jgi:predicted ATPase/DNA-binding SARP family transcriptional activator
MSRYKLHFLGSPYIEINHVPHAISRRKALALLAYLAVNQQVVNREAVATLLWSDSDTTRALSNLRTAIWALNKELTPDWAVLEGDMLEWNSASDGMVDVRHFRKLVETHVNQQAETSVQHETRIVALTEAVELYRGDFMAGFTLSDSNEYEDWLFLERENLRQLFATALEKLIESKIALGDYEAAIPYTRRWISLDSLHEPAHQMLMRLYAYTGQYAAAHRQHQQLEQILDAELGVGLSKETQALYRQIESRQLTPPVRVAPATINEPEKTETVESALPIHTTPFFGRERELEEIKRLLQNPDCRLLTLFGPGGVGKTRLALEAAQHVENEDGVYFVNLTPVTSPINILKTIVQVLKCYSQTAKDDETTLIQFIAEKHILLILDNFEHLLAGAPILSRLLKATPNLKLMTTSRERLNLQEEWIFDTEGLDFPDSVQQENWQSYSAIQLFINSARRVDLNFRVDEFSSKPIIEICKLAAGMPLAIELAASWVDMLDCSGILREIQTNLDFLSTESQSLPQRQRSLRAVFEYTWNRLEPEEQKNLVRLSIFVGAFTLDAAQKIAGTSIHDLRSLMNKALLRRPESMVFDIHELIRQYAYQKLDTATRDILRDKYVTYYGQFAQDQLVDFQSERQPFALYLYDRAFENMSQAWQWALESQRWDVISQLAEPIVYYHMVRWEFSATMTIVERTITRLQTIQRKDTQDLLLALLLTMKGLALRHVGHQSEVLELCQQAIDIIEAYPTRIETALPIMIITGLYTFPGSKVEQVEYLTLRGLALSEQHNKWLYAFSLYQYGFMLQNDIRYAEVTTLGNKALAIFQELGQPWGIVLAYDLLAEHAITLGDNPTASRHLQTALPYIEKLGAKLWAEHVRDRIDRQHTAEYDIRQSLSKMQLSLQHYRQSGNKQGEAWALFHNGWSYHVLHDLKNADAHLGDALVVFRGLGSTEGIAWSLVYLGKVAEENYNLNLARQYIAEALKTIEGLQMPWMQSGADFVLGHIELAAGHFEKAYRHFIAAIQLAWDVQSILQVLRHLTGLAIWYAQMEEYDKALELATAVLEHPARGPLMSEYARTIVTNARTILSPAEFALYQTHVQSLSLTEVIEMVLSNQRISTS